MGSGAMSSLRHSPNGLRRARVEYTVVDGQLRGTVVLQGGSELPFKNAAELERCLGVGSGSGRLVLVEDGTARGDEDGLAGLSPTELAIARAALGGASNREIADALFYSVKSVEAYLTRVYRRLGIEGRSGLESVSGVLEDLEPLPEQADLVAGGAASSTSSAVAVSGSVVIELLLV
jgi:DNA-binding CsgD family transcriptional regulator